MKHLLWHLWCHLNYRFCMTEAYLASHRGEAAVSADYEFRAHEWQRHLDIIHINKEAA